MGSSYSIKLYYVGLIADHSFDYVITLKIKTLLFFGCITWPSTVQLLLRCSWLFCLREWKIRHGGPVYGRWSPPIKGLIFSL